jgi:tetratricopeptide (TPR) repeat protein
MTSRLDRVRTVELAEKLVRSGKIREAIVEYEKLIADDPQDVGTLNIIGDLHAQSGQNDRAVQFFLRGAEEYEKRGLFSQAVAICKKVIKLSPDNPDHALKLADLYSQQGFLAEAKKEYLKLADRFIREKKTQDAVHIYEKVARLDRDDLEIKKTLSGLYIEMGFTDAAVEQLNEIAEARMGQGRLDAAEKVLQEGMTLMTADSRTVLNLVEVYKRQNRSEKAIELVEESLTHTPNNVLLLNILGNFNFEKGDFERAAEVFSAIVTNHPMNVNARIKLGRIHILKEKLDEAFELYEPLINNLVKKQKDEKAIGLLGLILESQKPHLPALDRLAAIYRTNKEMKKLEVVDRTILEELRKQGAREKMLAVLSELRQLRPEDAEIAEEYQTVSEDLGISEGEAPVESAELTDKDKELIQETISQSDLYMQQGLVRNARRILENLRQRYPDVPQIVKKIAVLDEIRTHMDEKELRKRIEQTSAMEAKIKDKIQLEQIDEIVRKPFRVSPQEIPDEEKISTADIFAETDIIPFVALESAAVKYYELRDQIAAELTMLKAAANQQIQGGMPQEERDLEQIVTDFKKDLKSKLSHEDPETHYQLGLAFLEQGLYTEAVEELIVASKEKALALGCFSVISACCRLKKNLSDAEKWLKKALNLAKDGSDQFHALEFDMAELLEEKGERDKALQLYAKIRDWNPGFRDVSAKIESLEKQAADQSA